MVVVANRIVVGDKLEYWRIAAGHVVEAHRFAALDSLARRRRWGRVVRPDSGLHGNPREQVRLALVELLPHLKEPMDRIAGETNLIRVIFGYLEWAIGQVRGKPLVGHV